MDNDIIDNIIGKINNFKFYQSRYRAQLKNKHNPNVSCFPSSVSNMLSHFDIEISPDTIIHDANIHADLWRGVNKIVRYEFRSKMFQLWQVEENVINFYLPKYKATQRYKISLEALKQFVKFNPVIINTAPKYRGRVLGHIMLIVGIVDDGFIIDDPFGDFRVNYATGHYNKGNDLFVTFKEFEKIRGTMAITLQER